MKRLLLSFTILLQAGFAFAKPVSEATARQVGWTFLSRNAAPENLRTADNLTLAYSVGAENAAFSGKSGQDKLLYVFNAGAKGFVIVAGDDVVAPVLGYSTQSNFNAANQAPNLRKWLEGYKSQIRYAVAEKLEATPEIQNQWAVYQTGKNPKNLAKATASVNPLVQTTWDQSPYYNDLAPYDSAQNDRSVTGCVATAMAQIMKYWNHPAKGSGFHTYNHSKYGTLSANFGATTYQWTAMPNAVSSANAAVATLMYHCGVSVDMEYSPQVSGAWVIEDSPTPSANSEVALKTYFGYKSTLQGVERKNFTQSQWISMLKTELDASRPILYDGFGTGGGHAFICDGYDANDFFHFNWGWGGYFDGFFMVDALNPGGTGTGGGTGGYNSGQQAVIGIEPSTTAQSYNLELSTALTPATTTIEYGDAFSFTTNIHNAGNTTFSGEFAAAIFNQQGVFMDFVQTLPGAALPAGSAYSSNLVFSNSAVWGLLPGNYTVQIYYRPTGGAWSQVANNGSYVNTAQLVVVNESAIEVNSGMTITPGTTLKQGQPVSVNLNILNDSTNTFVGQYGVGLYRLDGTLAQTIDIVSETTGLAAGATYAAPYLTFSNPMVTAAPGTYLLAVQHNRANTGWQLTGSSYFDNPVFVVVQEAPITPDAYEVNDTLPQARNLPLAFSGNNATKVTTGANFHTGTDYDFYKIVLPAGYDYTVTARLRDLEDTTASYTADALFSYSTNATSWTGPFDDVMPGNITVTNGGTVYFHVAPYFAGEVGTYVLDLKVVRARTTGIENPEISGNISLYPNPAKDLVTLDWSALSGEVRSVALLNLQGQTIATEAIVAGGPSTHTFSLKNMAAGIYLVKLQTTAGVVTRKLIVEK